jgi:hypothetical protein
MAECVEMHGEMPVRFGSEDLEFQKSTRKLRNSLREQMSGADDSYWRKGIVE